MPYAQVIVDIKGLRTRDTYTYAVPSSLEVAKGDFVLVPFGAQIARGVIAQVDVAQPEMATRDIIDVHTAGALWPWQVDVALWMMGAYLCSAADAIGPFLPYHLRQATAISARARPECPTPANLREREAVVLGYLSSCPGFVTTKRLSAAVGGTGLQATLTELQARGCVELRERRANGPPTARARTVVCLKEARDSGGDEAVGGRGGFSEAMEAALDYLSEATVARLSEGEEPPIWILASEVTAATSCAMAHLKRLESSGLVELATVTPGFQEEPAVGLAYPTRDDLDLTAGQERALDRIAAALDRGRTEIFLLHGVTGAGKTEVYLRAIDHVVEAGRQAVVLVPEIALTPQTMARFSARFPGVIGLVHSGKTEAERQRVWEAARSGEAKVIVGSRSAVFTPVARPGLFVVDEEHEWTYRQDRTPRYDAREVAIALAQRSGAAVVLGSASPDVASYLRAQRGVYTLLEIDERIAFDDGTGGLGSDGASNAPRAAGGALVVPLPEVSVVDMRRELREGQRGVFSRLLEQSLRETLAAGEQAILFVNRRGTSSFALCRDCGFVPRCRRCAVAMVLHTGGGSAGVGERMECHHCGRKSAPLVKCPECGSSRIGWYGLGTERLESEVRALLPGARVVRWDRDVVKCASEYVSMTKAFATREYDVLVGTQMVAKGLDFPGVSLVGVVDADTVLNLPDMRAGERAFQLLVQVAGRAGRRSQGRVVVQTYCPDHYAVQAASKHDYRRFAARELDFRRANGYPPYRTLVRYVFRGSRSSVEQAANRFANEIRESASRSGLAAFDVVGPMPCFLERLRGSWRWQVLVFGHRPLPFLRQFPLPLGCSVEVDPLSVM